MTKLIREEALERKREDYKEKILEIPDSSYNREQKQLALDILNKADLNNIDSIYVFITRRIKLGFIFDSAPEVNHNAVSLIKYNKELSFGSDLYNIEHKLIIGENYDALKNLLIVYKNKIDVIYIDPPYNTESAGSEGNNYKDRVESSKFIYRDKFSRNGWLNMMNERLRLAKKLLSDRGVIFISIDDNEQAYLKVLCDEIFGKENFVKCLIRKTKSFDRVKSDSNLQDLYDYVLCYGKNKNNLIFRQEISSCKEYNYEDDIGKYRLISLQQPGGQHATRDERPNLYYSIYYNENTKEFSTTKKDNFIEILPKKLGLKDGRWMWSKEKFNKDNKDCIVKNDKIFIKRYFKENEDQNNYKHLDPLLLDFHNSKGTKDLSNLSLQEKFSFPKPVELLKFIINCIKDKDSIILDFFAGSGTTGQAVMELNEEDGGNRQCILVTNNENNIARDITRERLYRVIKGKGTRRETFEWKYSKNKSYLEGNRWDVFEMETTELKIDDFEKAEKLKKDAKKQFKILNKNFEIDDINLYTELASLNLYKKEEWKK